MHGGTCYALFATAVAALCQFGQRREVQKTTPDEYGGKSIFARTPQRPSMTRPRATKMTQKTCESEYEFTLVLTGVEDLTPQIVDALYEAGCDDATIAARSGRVYVTFDRASDSMKNAILSAIANVRNAGVGADVLRVDYCNLVTQADIARKIGRSRELVRQYIVGKRGPGGFPAPVCEITDGSPLWYWCEVAYWLWQNDMIKESALRDAEEVDMINAVLELHWQKQRKPDLAAEVMERCGAP